MKWGFIGSKGITVTVANDIKNNKDQEIVSVYSPNFKHCEEFAKKFNCIPCKSFEELVETGVEAIYVGTPHSYHYLYAKKALEKGIPVLCEKSFTLNLKSSEELFEIAKKNNTYLVEAMWTWFNPTANKVREWINDGKIGKCISFSGDFSIPSLYFVPKKRLYDVSKGGGALYDLGVYPVTYAYALFGYPDKIIAKGKIKNNVDNWNDIIFEYKNGLKCHITSAISKFGHCSVKIIGEKGTIKVPFMFHEARKATLKGEQKEVFKDKEKINLYEREFVLTSKEINDGLKESNYVPMKQTLDVMKIMEEVKKQIGLNYKLEKD